MMFIVITDKTGSSLKKSEVKAINTLIFIVITDKTGSSLKKSIVKLILDIHSNNR